MSYEWETRSPNIRERIAAGVWLAAFLVAETSYQAGWRLFGDHDRQVTIGLIVVALLGYAFFMPKVVRR